MAPFSVAVVGAGIGVRHMMAWRSLAEQFSLAAVVETDSARREQAATIFEIPTALDDYGAILDRDDIDIVDICTPPHLHFDMIRRALAAGKRVVCEKPLVMSLAACDEIARVEAASRHRVMPIFQYRFGTGLQKLALLKQRGLLGRCYLSTVETAWTRGRDYYAVEWRGKWKTEYGGTLLSHAIHNHDMLCYVVGRPRRVFAHTATRVNPIETEDCAAVSLEMNDGSLATLSVTLGAAVELSRLRFCFEALTAESCTEPYAPSAEPWTFTPTKDELRPTIESTLAQFQPEPEDYEGQFTRYHRALLGEAELPVTLQDARNALELVTAMYASSQTGQAIELPISAESRWYKSWLPPEHQEEAP